VSALQSSYPAWVIGTTALDEQPDPLSAAITSQQMAAMLAAAQLLTPRQRVVIRMRYADNQTWAQIGIALSVTTEAAFGLHNRAITAIRQQLGIRT
jgi:DNA-directed RNA polymerase specialized sigma subunit